jgi:hypothetical protein
VNVGEWLLDSDPAIRWQVMQDVLHNPTDVVAAERAKVATQGWGARILDSQASDGTWGGDAETAKWIPADNPWMPPLYILLLLKDLGVDPANARVQTAVGLVQDNFRWGEEFGDLPFFGGEVEACINGKVVAIGSYFGQNVDPLLERLLGEQLADGGWNCEAPASIRSSFNSTMSVLDALIEYERAHGEVPDVTDARVRAQEYLLDRHLMRALSTGEIINPKWLEFSFPNRYYYDVLWALDLLRAAGVAPDSRVAEAVELVERKRQPDGRWPLDRYKFGEVDFPVGEVVGEPSRWVTLRALRVLEWAGR